MSESELPTNHASQESVFARVARFGRAALGVALDVALPPLCAACRTPLGDPGGLCPVGWSRVSLIAPPYCQGLGIHFTIAPEHGILFMEQLSVPPAEGGVPPLIRHN